MDKEIREASQNKRVYKLKNGKRVQGVTTILAILAKPALIKWANNLGLQGIDSSHYTDETARIGTLAHSIIQNALQNDEAPLDTSLYGQMEIDKANKSFALFKEWEKTHDIEVLGTELQLVSEKYKYGGTIDLLAKIDGEINIVDFKTGTSGIFPEHYYQVCAYRNLVIENLGLDVKRVRILNIPRGGIDKFTEMVYNEFALGWKIFKCCKRLVDLIKESEE